LTLNFIKRIKFPHHCQQRLAVWFMPPKTSPIHKYLEEDTIEKKRYCKLCPDRKKGWKISSGTNSVRNHLRKRHAKEFEALEKAEKKLQARDTSKKRKHSQPTMQEALMKPTTDEGRLRRATTELFAVHSLPHNLLSADEFKEFIKVVRETTSPVPGRERLRSDIITQGKATVERVYQVLSRCVLPCTIVLDGWTNVRHNKVSNILLCDGNSTYFCFSHENSEEKNDVKHLKETLVPLLEIFLEKKVEFIALTVDNEATMTALAKALKLKFPWLLHIPCAAHTIQLCLEKIAKLPTLKPTFDEVFEVVDAFAKDKDARLKLRKLQLKGKCGPKCKEQPKRIIKPAATRWSSRITSADRLLELKEGVDNLFPRERAFWEKLERHLVFLRPFKTATDTAQRDASNLYAVWKEFNLLKEHVQNHGAIDAELKELCQQAATVVDTEWKTHVNVHAAAATALFSFNTLDAALGEPTDDKLHAWIADWGTQYIAQFKQRLTNDEQEAMKKKLLYLANSFATLTGPFEDALDVKAQIDQMCADAGAKPDLKLTWRKMCTTQKNNIELSWVAIALISLCASEAAAERSFSAQQDVHSKDRNRLSKEAIEAEMRIKWNIRKLKRKDLPEDEEEELSDAETPGVVEL